MISGQLELPVIGVYLKRPRLRNLVHAVQECLVWRASLGSISLGSFPIEKLQISIEIDLELLQRLVECLSGGETSGDWRAQLRSKLIVAL